MEHLHESTKHSSTHEHHMVVMHHDEDSLNDEAPKTMCIEQANQGSYFLFNTRGRTRDQDSNWETSLSFWANLPRLTQSFAEPGEEIHLHCESARHGLPSLYSNERDRHDGAELSSRLGQRG